MHGPAHSAIGQEGGAVGSALSMIKGDQVNGSHRAHHQFFAKALSYVAPDDLPIDAPFSGSIRDLSKKTMAEIMGLAQGFCHGRGGSMHLRWEEAGNLGTNAIVGGGAPLAAGAAFCHKHAGTNNVVYSYFGDGATNIGSVLETMNLAAAWKLPLCFFIENNRYAVSTNIEEATAETRVSSRGLAFGIPALKVDGMDVLAVYLACEEANRIMRAGEGPVIIEADVYRYFHQAGPLPGSAFGYRSKEEEQAWRKRDPLDALAAHLEQRQIVGEKDVAALRAHCVDLMNEVAGELTENVDGARRIIPALWPDEKFCDFGIVGDLSEFNGKRFEEEENFTSSMDNNTKFLDAVVKTMEKQMQQDKRIIVMGEDIHRLNGGSDGATRGLPEKFPNRVLGTPISENAFTGVAGGMASDGRFRPVVEYMFPDFIWVAADQLFNQIGKARHMFGGDTNMPLVARTRVAMGMGYGSQHSMDPTGIFATCPGWRIVAPSIPFDYIGLMNSALLCEDPVLVLEHWDLYSQRANAPIDDYDYYIPLGKAKVVKSGSKLTILTYLSMVKKCVDVVEKLGLDAEVIDLRSLDRAGLDWQTIIPSIQKTNNVVIVEEGPLGTSYGGLLADEVQKRCFDWLDQPVQRVYGSLAAPSISKVLEAVSRVRESDIEKALVNMMAEQGLPLSSQISDGGEK